MKTIVSRLENNFFAGVLITKGLNHITDKEYEKLKTAPLYIAACSNGLIIEKQAVSVKVSKEKTTGLNFDVMSYAELKEYAAKNNIKTASMKKTDILKALKGD